MVQVDPSMQNDDPDLDGTWRIMHGTGMGLIHSGDLCDLCLNILAERFQFKEFGVKLYVRYRDDILSVVHGRENAIKWFRHFRERCGFYRVSVEDISTESVNCLSMIVRRVGEKLTLEPCLKKAALSRTIDSTSGHPKHSNGTWMFAMIKDLPKTSTSQRAIHKTQKEIVRRLKVSGVHESILKDLSSLRPKLHTMSVKTWRPRASHARAIGAVPCEAWCPIRYHPAWRGLPHLFSTYSRSTAARTNLLLAFGHRDAEQLVEHSSDIEKAHGFLYVWVAWSLGAPAWAYILVFRGLTH